ncbi:hypothetical protein [Salinibacterium sp. ZJ70]|uniref:hypothetical protein n=1 Tax=Salinibacterium sp. ZJ70 TaxID=2708084 RepID=UPI001422DD18|nr:hypothetical protein [Salinibacterium sp. ZJ70]
MARGDPFVHITGANPVYLIRRYEMCCLQREFEHRRFTLFEVDFNALGPWSLTVRGPDVTIGWDDIYNEDRSEEKPGRRFDRRRCARGNR